MSKKNPKVQEIESKFFCSLRTYMASVNMQFSEKMTMLDRLDSFYKNYF